MSEYQVMALVSLLGCLLLVSRAMIGSRLAFESKAWMAVVWTLVIVLLAFAIGRFR